MNELTRKYLDYPKLRKGQDYDWDGRDMVLAINAMRDKGDWEKFYRYIRYEQAPAEVKYKSGEQETLFAYMIFGNPAKFFELFEAWLNEKAD